MGLRKQLKDSKEYDVPITQISLKNITSHYKV